MGEYQYYEFQALDKPLSPQAQAEMRSLSSRVHLTATSASFVYHYGSFRGNAESVLASHFDAMLYIANWGTRQLMFRFPAAAIPAEVMKTYQCADSLEWSRRGEYVLLNIALNPEEPDSGWIDGEGMLTPIVQVRQDILHGDYRALYIAWLAIAANAASDFEYDEARDVAFNDEDDEADYEDDDEEDLIEPPIPPNLHSLTPGVTALMEFFELDPDVVASAAEASPEVQKPDEDLILHLDRLTSQEKDDFLKRLLQGEQHLHIALSRRLREASGIGTTTPETLGRRSIHQIAANAETLRQQRLDRERQQEAARRRKHLETVAGQETRLWAQIPALIEQKQASAYDSAVAILKDLQELAMLQERLSEFQAKVAILRAQYPTLRGFHSRLKEAGILPGL